MPHDELAKLLKERNQHYKWAAYHDKQAEMLEKKIEKFKEDSK